MLLGYARTSTTDQKAGLEAQERDLKTAGVDPKHIYAEQTSAMGARPKLDAVLRYVREGDTLVVTKLDRLARSVTDLNRIVDDLQSRGVALRILAMTGGGTLDTATPNGRLMLNLLSSIAQFEREVMLERQREGIAKAKQDGKYKGRAPTAMAKREQVLALAASGMTKEAIAAKLGIGVASVYRALKAPAEAA